MNTKSFLLLVLLLITPFGMKAQKEPVDYVDCFVGTSNSRWMLGPYAQRPMGMVALGPDNQGDRWMGGYEYSINNVSGFSHIHAWTMGGLMMMPTTLDLALDNPSTDSPYKGANAGYHSRIMKDTEKAYPGYYAVDLYDHNVKVELTATKRCGFHKYTFPQCKESRVLVDLLFPTEWDYGFSLEDAEIMRVSDREIEGYAKCISGPWSSWNDWVLYFVVRFNKPFEHLNGWQDGKVQQDVTRWHGKGDMGVYATWNTRQGEVIMAQTGLSLVSIDGARRNLRQEMDPFGWDFNACAADARAEWNALLSRIKVEGGTERDRKKFYTNLYRAFAGKQTWNDVDGQYRDATEQVRRLQPGQSIYGGDALWNTYWNLNGLYSLVAPEMMDNWVTTQLEMYRHNGWTCKGPAGIEYSGIMEGSHEIALMVAAYQKGIRKDGESIYQAVRHTVMNAGGEMPYGGEYGQINLDAYVKYGYMPDEVDVVSKTLDYAYDDYCVAQLAKALGHRKDASYLEKRAQNYRNVFHPTYKYVCRRDSAGQWDPDFDVFSNRGFIEGNSWQYSWYVPHDMDGLLRLIGKDKASQRLTEGFEKSRQYNFAAHVFDRTMGQSAEFYINQGNEVNMNAAYVFNYLGEPWKCEKYVREIMNRYYGDTPYHGWEGDEDEGQMGAWYVMSALGLFEMNGGVTAKPFFDLAGTIFDKVTIQLNDKYYPGKTFTIIAHNNSPSNCFVKSATLNGKPLRSPRLPFSALKEDGTLVYEMTSDPAEAAWRK